MSGARGRMLPAQVPVIFTVGIPREGALSHARRVQTLLRQGGYLAAPTSDDAIRALYLEIRRAEENEGPGRADAEIHKELTESEESHGS